MKTKSNFNNFSCSKYFVGVLCSNCNWLYFCLLKKYRILFLFCVKEVNKSLQSVSFWKYDLLVDYVTSNIDDLSLSLADKEVELISTERSSFTRSSMQSFCFKITPNFRSQILGEEWRKTHACPSRDTRLAIKL
jgi:hypothetical protein